MESHNVSLSFHRELKKREADSRQLQMQEEHATGHLGVEGRA